VLLVTKKFGHITWLKEALWGLELRERLSVVSVGRLPSGAMSRLWMSCEENIITAWIILDQNGINSTVGGVSLTGNLDRLDISNHCYFLCQIKYVCVPVIYHILVIEQYIIRMVCWGESNMLVGSFFWITVYNDNDIYDVDCWY